MPSMTSSPISTRTPPMTSGSTTTLRCTGRSYCCESACASRSLLARRSSSRATRTVATICRLASAARCWYSSSAAVDGAVRAADGLADEQRTSPPGPCRRAAVAAARACRRRCAPGRRARRAGRRCRRRAGRTANSSSSTPCRPRRRPSGPRATTPRLLERVGEVARCGPARRTAACSRSSVGAPTALPKSVADQAGLGLGLDGGVGRDPAQRGLAAEQRRDAEQLLAQRRRRRRRHRPARRRGRPAASADAPRSISGPRPAGRPGLAWPPARRSASTRGRPGSARRRGSALVVLEALTDDPAGQRRSPACRPRRAARRPPAGARPRSGRGRARRCARPRPAPARASPR